MEIENPNANMNGGVLHRNNVQSVESRVALANDLMYRQSPSNQVMRSAIWPAGSSVLFSSGPSCKHVRCFVVLASATSMQMTYSPLTKSWGEPYGRVMCSFLKQPILQACQVLCCFSKCHWHAHDLTLLLVSE